MFKEASRLKYRYSSPKGNITTEDLWSLTLDQLDQVAIALDNDITSSKGKSFVKKETTENTTLVNKLEIVKHIIETKMTEAEARKNAADKAAKKNKILGLIAEKQDQALGEKSVEELMKEYDALG